MITKTELEKLDRHFADGKLIYFWCREWGCWFRAQTPQIWALIRERLQAANLVYEIRETGGHYYLSLSGVK